MAGIKGIFPYTFMEKYETQRYRETAEGNFEDAILRSLKCGADQESNDDNLKEIVLIKFIVHRY